MKFLISLLLSLFSVLQLVGAQGINFGDSTKVSLLTCEPGEELYSRFGHSAIRIQNEAGLDLVFNWGIFDFRTENFYLKFLMGHTDYLLGVSPTEYFLAEYRERNSRVWEQELDLTRKEKERLFELLNLNYEPQNRMYRYNFVFDNCATRPREMLQQSVEGRLEAHPEFTNETFRLLVNDHIQKDPWAMFGINLLFGSEADQKLKGNESHFLPLFLRNSMQHAKIVSLSGEVPERKLVKSLDVLVDGEDIIGKPSFWLFHPMTLMLLWLLTGLYLTFSKDRKSWVYKLFDSLLFFVTGLVGLVIFVLAFFSEHPLVGTNFNLLWLNPLNIFVPLLIWTHKVRRLLMFYYALNIIMILLFIVLSTLYVQVSTIYVIPLIALLLVRFFRRLRRSIHVLAIQTPKGLRWLN